MPKYRFQGAWKGKSAGGCMNHPSWRYNPQIFVTVPGSQKRRVTIELTQEEGKRSHIGFYVAHSDGTGRRTLSMTVEALTGKAGFEDERSVSTTVEMEPSDVPYVVIPCTFHPGEEAAFTITFKSDTTLELAPLSPSKEWKHVELDSEWRGRTAGGCRNNPTVVHNPQFLLKIKKPTTVWVLVTQTEKQEFDHIGVYVVKTADAHNKLASISSADVVGKAEFASRREAICQLTLEPGMYCVVPCTFDPGWEASFNVSIFSNMTVKLAELRDTQEKRANGEWADLTAGGCLNYPSWRNNPQFFLIVSTSVRVTVTLRQLQRDLRTIGFYVTKNRTGVQNRVVLLEQEDMVGKGAFDNRTSVKLEIELPGSREPYMIIPCTFHPGEDGRFDLSVFVHGESTEDVIQLLPCNYGWHQIAMKGEWKGKTAGGCRNNASTWLNNPQYSLVVNKKGPLVVLLTQTEEQAKDICVGLYVVRSNTLERIESVESGKVAGKSVFRVDVEVTVKLDLEPGTYTIVPTTFKAGREGSYELTVYSESDRMQVEVAGNAMGVASSKSVVHGVPKQRSALPPASNWEVAFDEIQVKEKIGQGGFGVVYRGIYRGQEVAVKRLFRDEMEDEDYASFKKEVELMSKLDHPNVVAFVGASMEYPNVCVLTHFCERGNLGQVLREEKELSWDIKMRMAIETSEGMLYLHQQNPPLVHRDLKSLNLLVNAEYHIAVADFGLSKQTHGNSLNSKVGSLNWCAPEVLLHSAPYTEKADVFSMGMVLWEFVTHESPFVGLHPLQIVRAIDQGDLPKIPSNVNKDYKQIIRDCWHTNPKSRPDFGEILERLKKLQNADGTAVEMMRAPKSARKKEKGSSKRK